MVLNGAQLFIRYAYAPNALGYCGPPDSEALFQYGAADVTDGGLVDLARGFEGAWPYLELIAKGTGIKDPLDRRVVEAYWVGNALLDQISVTEIGNSMEERFRARSGKNFSYLVQGVNAGGVPHHNFSVFAVSPWTGLLKRLDKNYPQALGRIDSCRIRWGRIMSMFGDEAVVSSNPLAWDGFSLSLASARLETVHISRHGDSYINDISVGDVVSLHWDWVCDKLSSLQLAQLQRFTSRHVNIANAGAAERGEPLPLG